MRLLIFTFLYLFFQLSIVKAQPVQPGSLDLSFNPGTGFSGGHVYAIAEQNDGKILVGGNFTSFNGNTVNRIARLNPNGSIDNTFTPETGANAEIYTIAIQPDGKILIGGNFTSFNNNNINHVARLNSNGTFDSSFNPGNGASNQVREILLQPDGKIIIAGWFVFVDNIWNNSVARLNTNGSLDTTFYSGNNGVNGEIYAAVSFPGKRTIIGGSFTSYNGVAVNRIACIDSAGKLDPVLSVGSGLDGIVTDIHLLNDTLLTIVGYFNNYNTVSSSNIVQLDVNGSMKTTLNPGTGTGTNCPYAVAVQNDGKVLIGGLFTSYNGTNVNFFTRINTDGTIDNSFISGTSAAYNVFAIIFQNNGKILIGGAFQSYNGKSIKEIARLRNAACNSTSSNINASSCDSYLSPSGNYTWTNSGNYIDTISNAESCDSVINITLTINTIDVTLTNNAPTLTSNAAGATYQWLDCNFSMAVINGATNQSYTATANGIYAVEVTQNGCKDTSACIAITGIGIIENDFGTYLKYYPNPTKANIMLEFDQAYKNIIIKIRNVMGEEVIKQSFNDSNKVELLLEESSGIYLVEIIADNKKALIKVIKK